MDCVRDPAEEGGGGGHVRKQADKESKRRKRRGGRRVVTEGKGNQRSYCHVTDSTVRDLFAGSTHHIPEYKDTECDVR